MTIYQLPGLNWYDKKIIVCVEELVIRFKPWSSFVTKSSIKTIESSKTFAELNAVDKSFVYTSNLSKLSDESIGNCWGKEWKYVPESTMHDVWGCYDLQGMQTSYACSSLWVLSIIGCSRIQLKYWRHSQITLIKQYHNVWTGT